MGGAVSTATTVTAWGRGVARLSGWLFAPMPMARVAALRVLVFAFVVVDVLLLHTSGWYHGYADPVWYEPLVMGQVLHLPGRHRIRVVDRHRGADRGRAGRVGARATDP